MRLISRVFVKVPRQLRSDTFLLLLFIILGFFCYKYDKTNSQKRQSRAIEKINR